MAVKAGIEFTGMAELMENLDLSIREARNLNRAVIHAVAGEIRNEARKKAPKDEGTLKKAIKSVRRKPKDINQPFSDVVVETGKNAKYDAFYWRFVEYGTITQPARPYFQPAIDDTRPQVPVIYRQQFGKKYEALLKRKAKKAGRGGK